MVFGNQSMKTAQRAKLVDIAAIRSGHPFRSKIEHTPEAWDHYVLQLKDVQKECRLDYSQMSQIAIDEGPRPHPLKKGDILLRARGGYYYGGLFDSNLPNVVAAGHIFVLTPNPEIADSAYLCWYLNQPEAQRYLERNDSGTNIPMINKGTASFLPVVLPPLATQRKIATIQRNWMEEKHITEQLLSNRERMVRGICQQFISGKIQ